MVEQPKRGKVLKSLSLPQKSGEELEQLAKKMQCTQGDLVKVAIKELVNMPEDELTELLVEHYIL